MVQLGNPDLQPFVAVRSLYRVHSPERRGVPVHVLRSLSPTCHIMIRRLVGNMKYRFLKPAFFSQVIFQRRQELRQKLLARNRHTPAARLVLNAKIPQQDFVARPAALAKPCNKTRLKQIHTAGIPEYIGPLVELREIKFQGTIGILFAYNQVKTNSKNVLSVFSHIFSI